MISRRTAIAAGLATTAFATLPACKASAVPQIQWDDIDNKANRLLKDGLTPGICLSVMQNGELLYSKAFGYANIENKAVMTT